MCKFVCPKCGSDHHGGCDVRTTTAMYFQPIWKDGKNINPDANKSSAVVHCYGCNSNYAVRWQFGKIIEMSQCLEGIVQKQTFPTPSTKP